MDVWTQKDYGLLEALILYQTIDPHGEVAPWSSGTARANKKSTFYIKHHQNWVKILSIFFRK
jgi:hypothetical protein